MDDAAEAAREMETQLREASLEDAQSSWMDPAPRWSERSRLLSEAADEIERLYRALLSSRSEVERMREALAFYAEGRRYDGPNQNNPGNDPHTAPDAPYMTDVTRDLGYRARAALSPQPPKGDAT